MEIYLFNIEKELLFKWHTGFFPLAQNKAKVQGDGFDFVNPDTLVQFWK